MTRHLFRLFARNFRSNLTINLLNLLGLAAGMAVCLLILIYLHHEFSYDAFQVNRDRLVRINTVQKVGDGQELRLPSASYPVADGLASEISAVENRVRLRLGGKETAVHVGDKVFFESHLAWADASVFEAFYYPLIAGDPKTALAAAERVVLSESTARRFFGEADPMGKRIRLGPDQSYAVSGVMKDIPQPSHLPSHPMILSLETLDIGGADYWVGRSFYASYLLLREGVTAREIQPLVDKVYLTHAGELMQALSAECRVTLQPLSEIHFDREFDFAFDFQPTVSYQKIAVFSVLAFFILVVACVGFVNLSTAKSGERARQVGICKAMGASRGSLIRQFLGESQITSLLALVVALHLVHLLLPIFGDFVGRDLSLNYTSNLPLLLSFLALAILVGLLAGLYPAFFLTRFQPVDTIKGSFVPGSWRSRLRPALIVFQFTIATLLLLCTMTVRNQLQYMDNRYPGFDREQVLVLTVPPGMTLDDCNLLRSEALRHQGILAGTLCSHLPSLGYMEYTYRVPQPADSEMLMTFQFNVDPHFIDAMKMDVTAGRNFTENPNEVGSTVIINETAARKLGWPDPVGRHLDANPAQGEANYSPVEIIGVVSDINFDSLHNEIQPMLLAQSRERPGKIALRLHPKAVPEAIRHVRHVWEINFPAAPLRYKFLDDSFAQMYHTEIRLRKLFTFFTVLALVISCIGLCSLIAFAAERRTREIGIRKVLGATTGSLLYSLSREYLFLVLLANLLAWPLSAWAMRQWTENFAYRAPFLWWLYPAAALLTLFLAMFSAGSYTWKACQVNPVQTLREE